jgi:hypothetical protein
VPLAPSLEHGPVDHEVEFKCKVYENGRVAAGPETLRLLASFSERQIREATGVRRDTAMPFLLGSSPFGVLASQACPYCYNTGYSSPGTRCSYCRNHE